MARAKINSQHGRHPAKIVSPMKSGGTVKTGVKRAPMISGPATTSHNSGYQYKLDLAGVGKRGRKMY